MRVLRLAADNGDVVALNNLGSMLGRLGMWEDARRVLEHAHDREPADANVESNLGWVYANLGRLDLAAPLLEEAIMKQPQEPSAHGNLGWVRLRGGDPGGALTALAVGQTLDPGNAWIANMQGIAHARLGEWPAAVSSFQRAITLSPDSELARDNLARAEQRLPPTLPGEPPTTGVPSGP